MRAIAESAGKTLGQQMVVENKAGASGMLGPNELVKAAPDGYTLSQLTIGVARLPHMQKTQFDPLKDFTYSSPFGIGAPRGLDPAVTQKLHDAFRKSLEVPPCSPPSRSTTGRCST